MCKIYWILLALIITTTLLMGCNQKNSENVTVEATPYRLEYIQGHYYLVRDIPQYLALTNGSVPDNIDWTISKQPQNYNSDDIYRRIDTLYKFVDAMRNDQINYHKQAYNNLLYAYSNASGYYASDNLSRANDYLRLASDIILNQFIGAKSTDNYTISNNGTPNFDFEIILKAEKP